MATRHRSTRPPTERPDGARADHRPPPGTGEPTSTGDPRARARAGGPTGDATTAERLVDTLVRLVAALEGHGWQPADLVWVGERTSRGAAAPIRLAVLAEAAHSTAGGRWVPPRWQGQLRALAHDAVGHLHGIPLDAPLTPGAPASAGVDVDVDWRAALTAWLALDARALGVVEAAATTLAGLQPVAALEPVPASWPRGTGPADRGGSRSGVDAGTLARVRALLAKAESTAFEAEAIAFTAKAQELIARHAIDTMLLTGADDERRQAAVGRRLHLDDPYRRRKQVLLGTVAAANRCRVISDDRYGLTDLFGHPDDLDAVELLFTSLLVQATNAMLAAGRGHDGGAATRTRAFRSSFLHGFAGRVGERLASAAADAAAEAQHRTGTALVPILTERVEAADQAADARYPAARQMRVSASNADGWRAGRHAADRAELGGAGRMAPGQTAAGSLDRHDPRGP